MAFGFFVIFLAAAAGAFLATDITQAFLRDKQLLSSWTLMLGKSAHGHANLFGLVHIAFGLTLPYSIWGPRVKVAQTVGLALGTVAMGIVMLIRAYVGPTGGIDLTEAVLGIFLSCALAALFTHAAGLAGKLLRRG